MKKFKESLIEEIEISDIESMSEPFYTGDERNDVEMPDNDVWYEADSINIDVVIKTLEQLKNNGANRVYLYSHGDHNSYILTGVNCQEIK